MSDARRYEVALSAGDPVTVAADTYRHVGDERAYVFHREGINVFTIQDAYVVSITDKTVEPTIEYVNVLADPEYLATLRAAIETGLDAAFGDGLTGKQLDAFNDAFTAALETADAGDENHPEKKCWRCHGPNVGWSAPSPLWNQVMRSGDINNSEIHNGIVCPTCFAILAEEEGIATHWRLYAERVNVPLQTTTPSGRVWNNETWMFENPEAPNA